MSLVLIGVNHKTAPIEVRERIAISREICRRPRAPWPPCPAWPSA
jgi:glutamyl-tRNA reductase